MLPVAAEGGVTPYLARWPDVDVDVKQKFQFGGIGALFGYEIDLLVTPDPLHKPGLRFDAGVRLRAGAGRRPHEHPLAGAAWARPQPA